MHEETGKHAQSKKEMSRNPPQRDRGLWITCKRIHNNHLKDAQGTREYRETTK